MRKNWLEKKLYNRLKDKPADLDLDAVWQELEARRYPKNGRKKSGFLWTFGLMLLAFLFTSLFLTNSNTPQNQGELLANNTQSSIKESKVQTKSALLKDKEIAKSDNSEMSVNKDSEIKKSAIKPQPQLSSEKAKSKTQIKNHASVLLKKNKLTQDVSNRISLANQRTVDQHSQDNGIDNYASADATTFRSRSAGIIASNEASIQSIENILFLPMSNLELFDISEDYPLVLPSKTQLVKLPNLKKARKRIGLSMAYGNMQGGLEEVLEGLYSETVRSELENSLDRFDVGLNFDFFITDKIFLTTGLSFEQYTSSYSNVFQSDEMITVRDTISLIIDPQVGTQYVLGEVEQAQYYQRSNFLKYRTLRIPVGIGIDMPIAKTIDFSLVSGVSIGVYSLSKGSFVNVANDSENLSSLDDSYYKNVGLIGGFAQLGFEKHLGNWSVGLDAKCNFDLNNRINQSENFGGFNLHHQMQSLGISLSLNRKF